MDSLNRRLAIALAGSTTRRGLLTGLARGLVAADIGGINVLGARRSALADSPDVGGAEMTLLSRGELVQDVLARISAHTGTRLKAEPDPGWQRVVIHVRNRLPRVILGDLAHLFASTWHAPTGSGPWRLVRNQRLQAHEASLLVHGSRN